MPVALPRMEPIKPLIQYQPCTHKPDHWQPNCDFEKSLARPAVALIKH